MLICKTTRCACYLHDLATLPLEVFVILRAKVFTIMTDNLFGTPESSKRLLLPFVKLMLLTLAGIKTAHTMYRDIKRPCNSCVISVVLNAHTI